jgi:RNA polymerase sigma-70 factor (ECF subfamily)
MEARRVYGQDMDIVALFRQEAGRVEQLLRRFGVAERDLADATQEVFVVVHRKLSEFEGRASISTWLYQICLRVAASERRRARHRREVLDADAEPREPSDQPDLHSELERRRLLEHIADALEGLHEPQRTTLVLHELEGLHVREIARRLRVPVKTAFSRLYAARAQLRELLRRQGYAIPAWFPIWPGAPWRAFTAYKSAAISGRHAAAAKGSLAAAFAVCTVLLASAPQPTTEPHALKARAALAPTHPAPRTLQSPSPQAAGSVARAKRASAHAAERAPARPSALEPRPAPADPAQDIKLIRMSSTDLTPVIEHPLAAKLRASSPSLPPMAARLAPSSFEPEF